MEESECSKRVKEQAEKADEGEYWQLTEVFPLKVERQIMPIEFNRNKNYGDKKKIRIKDLEDLQKVYGKQKCPSSVGRTKYENNTK